MRQVEIAIGRSKGQRRSLVGKGLAEDNVIAIGLGESLAFGYPAFAAVFGFADYQSQFGGNSALVAVRGNDPGDEGISRVYCQTEAIVRQAFFIRNIFP